MFVHRLEGRDRLLGALMESMILNHSAEFHPCISLLLHCLQCEQRESDVEGMIKQVQLMLHPRRMPYPLRTEATSSNETLNHGKQVDDIRSQQPILPFPELSMAARSEDVRVVSKPKIKTPIIPEQRDSTKLDAYMTELEARIQKARICDHHAKSGRGRCAWIGDER